MVLKHYFRPGQEDFRLALEGAMPKLLTVGSEKARAGLAKGEIEISAEPAIKTAKEEMRDLIGQVKSKGLRERMVKALERIS